MLCFSLEESFFIAVEIVSFLYATLMSTANAQSSNPTLPDATINLVTDALCMLNFMATVDLKVLQVGRGGGGGGFSNLHLYRKSCRGDA